MKPTEVRNGDDRIRRSPADLAKIGACALAQVRSKQGQHLEQIGQAIRMDTGVLKKSIAQLLEAKKLKKKGWKRGTKNFVGQGVEAADRPLLE